MVSHRFYRPIGEEPKKEEDDKTSTPRGKRSESAPDTTEPGNADTQTKDTRETNTREVRSNASATDPATRTETTAAAEGEGAKAAKKPKWIKESRRFPAGS